MHSSLAVVVPVFLTFLTRQTLAQQLPSCNATNHCPDSLPCCSEYGFCGTGAYCLGGCNPFGSRSIAACAPNPVCQDASYTFSNTNRFISSTSWNGDATAYDWVINQGNLLTTNDTGGELVLTLSKENQGTRISSTRYMQYGTVTARIKTGRWGGVVNAFITMSDVKDEIDWEFPGAWTTEGQTNYFWKGVWPNPTNGHTEKGLTDTYANYHDYTIDWQPKTLTFLIDGKAVRTIQQKDTVDKSGVGRYPNTPARIQFSLWPSGIPGTNEGTVAWGGGMINWNDPDYVSAGHFYMYIKNVTIKCADSSSNRISGVSSYTYGSNVSTSNPQILLTNGSTVLGTGNTAQGLMIPMGSLYAATATVMLSMLATYVL